MAIRVYLADDHPLIREALRVLLEAQGDLQLVGEAGDGRQTVRQVTELRPDVVVMDITMPELNGIEATAQLQQLCPAVNVVMLSMHATTEYVHQALQAGARGYVLKECAGKEVIEAIRRVHSGQRYLSQRLTDSLVEACLRPEVGGPADGPLEHLSGREREVMQLVVEGHTSADIAKTLFLSPKTVATYRSRLQQKLGVSDLPSLVKFAIQHHIISLD